MLNETLPALARIKESGKARSIGVSGYPLAALERMAEEFPLDVVLSYCHGNLLDRSLFDELQAMRRARSGGAERVDPPLGVLTTADPPLWHPAPDEVKAVGGAVARLCEERGTSIVENVALRATRWRAADPLDPGRRPLRRGDRAQRPGPRRGPRGDAELLDEIEAMVAPVLGATWPSGHFD